MTDDRGARGETRASKVTCGRGCPPPEQYAEKPHLDRGTYDRGLRAGTGVPATGALSDRLARVALQPERRARLFERTRAILRRNLPLIEAWLAEAGGFSWIKPEAGAKHQGRVTIDLDKGWTAANVGVAAFLQDPDTLRIYGAAVR